MEKSQLIKFEKFKSYLNRRSFNKDIFTVTLGNYAGAVAAFICNLLVGRHLGPSGFGMFAIFLTLFPVIFELTGYGLDSALVRFATPEIARNKDTALILFKLILNWKILLNLVFIFIGLTFLKPVILWMTGSTEYLSTIQYAFFMGFAFSLWRYVLAIFQSLQTYLRYFFTLLFTNLLRLGLIVIVYFSLSLDMTQIMMIYIGSTFLGFLVGMIIIPDSFPLLGIKLQNIGTRIKEINKFSIWIILSTLIFILIEPLNVFMIKHFHEHYSVGIFAAALILVKGLDILNLSIKTVFLPKVSLLDRRAYWEYVKTCLKITMPLAIIVLPIFFMSTIIIDFFFTHQFSGSIQIFNVLFWGYWISLLLDPIWLLFFTEEKTYYLVCADALMLFIVFGCNLLFIPHWGALGAAYSFVIARVLGRCLLGIILLRLSRGKDSFDHRGTNRMEYKLQLVV